MEEEAVCDEGFEDGQVVDATELRSFIYDVVTDAEVYGEYRHLEFYPEGEASRQLLGEWRAVEAYLVCDGVDAGDVPGEVYPFVVLDVDRRAHRQMPCQSVKRIDMERQYAEFSVQTIFLVHICQSLGVPCPA